MEQVDIIKNSDERFGIAVLNAPPLNIFTRHLKNRLRLALEELEADDRVAVIIIAGAGGRAFSVGSDIKELQATIESGAVKERAEHENALNNYIERLAKPTIAAIDGYALGGGLEMALACDMRVCSENASLGFPEIKLALFPAGGGSERLPRLVGYARAIELTLTGEAMDAETALHIGLVNRVARGKSAREEAEALAGKIARFPMDAIVRMKKVLRRGVTMDFDQANLLAIADSVQAFGSVDAREGIKAFLEKREPKFNAH